MTVLVLEPRPRPAAELLRDIWRSRRLILTLARKDLFVRYRRASLGLLWAVGLPVIQALTFSLVFTRVVRVSTAVPYIAFVFAGMTAWSYFAQTVPAASTAIVDNSPMASRIYFPRAVLPLVLPLTNLLTFPVNVAILLLVCVLSGVHLGVATLLLVPATMLLVAITVTLSLVLAALHVYVRDVRYVVQALFTVLLYLTPVIYPLTAPPHWFVNALRVNPLTGVVELFRAATVGADNGWEVTVATSTAAVVLLAALALWLHRRFDRLFTDLL